MLKQRVVTAVVLLIVLLSALFSNTALLWNTFIFIALVAAFYEWLGFCQIRRGWQSIPASLAFGLFLGALWNDIIPMHNLVVVLCLLWLVLLVFTFSESMSFMHNVWIKIVVVGILIIGGAGTLVMEFKALDNGPYWILCFMVSVWAADIGAYFVGKRFGKTKLAPTISPGKTIEGLAGGIALVLLVFIPVIIVLFDSMEALLVTLTVLATSIISVAGDLFESKLKRFADLKDSSQILPGHGGVLDRIDSLLAGAPVFAAGLLVLGYL